MSADRRPTRSHPQNRSGRADGGKVIKRIRNWAARTPQDDERTVAAGMKLIVAGVAIMLLAAVLGTHS